MEAENEEWWYRGKIWNGFNSEKTFIGKDGTLPVLGYQLLNVIFSEVLDPEAVAIQKR